MLLSAGWIRPIRQASRRKNRAGSVGDGGLRNISEGGILGDVDEKNEHARALANLRRTRELVCEVCKKPFTARQPARTCGNTCRQAALRARRAGRQAQH